MRTGFEARYHRFSHVRSVGLLSERLYGPLQIKHATYLMAAVLAGWRGLALRSGGLIALALALVTAGLLSAAADVKTMSFEAKILAITCSLLDALLGGRGGGRKDVKPLTKVRKVRASEALKIATPTLSATTPVAAWALASVLQSSVDASLKTLLSALIVAAVVVPHALGLLW